MSNDHAQTVYVVQYPVREDGCIQYKYTAFRSNAAAYRFANEHGATVRKVEVRD